MRESCKSSGEAAVRGNSDRGRRRGGDDGADKWGPCGSDRGKGVSPGLRKLKEEVASGNYAKATQAGMSRARVCGPREGGTRESGRAERPDGRTSRWAVLGRK
jgi:hypothetical protein